MVRNALRRLMADARQAFEFIDKPLQRREYDSRTYQNIPGMLMPLESAPSFSSFFRRCSAQRLRWRRRDEIAEHFLRRPGR